MAWRTFFAAILLLALAIAGRAQNLADFGFNASPLPPSRPVLVILPSYPGLTVSGTTLQWHQLVFDNITSNSPPHFSVAQWASENSNGRFTITPASLAVAVSMTANDSYNAIAAANPGWND